MNKRVESSLGVIRKRRGVGAADLARRVGVSRQTIYAIERGDYVPNTTVALELSHELEVGVEDLFALSTDRKDAPKSLTAEYLGKVPPRSGQAVRLCRVGKRWVTVPADAHPSQLPEADALVSGSPSRQGKTRIRPLSDDVATGNKILLAGCDPATGLLARLVEKQSGVEIVHAPGSSQLALNWLRDGKVHVGGCHLSDPRTSDFNMPFIRRHFSGRDVAVVTFARWEEGFVVARGNPRSVRTIEDLGRPDVRLMNREPGSGSRVLLESWIGDAGLRSKAIRGYDRVRFGHLAAADSVLRGEADCCIATRAAAQAFGLDFVALVEEQYDFVLERETLQLAGVEAFIDCLQRATLRRQLEMLAGYDTSQTGTVRA